MKPALIFIHGFRGSHLGLEEIAKEFPDYQVFLPDIPPFGKSKSLDDYNSDTYANFIADYIKKNKLERPVLVGHSMGSIIAAAAAEKYPKIVNKKLVLLAPISVKPAKFFAKLQPLSVVLPRRAVDVITTLYLAVGENREELRRTLEITGECSKEYISKAEAVKAGDFSAMNAVVDFKPKKEILMLAGKKDRLISRKKTEEVAKKLGARAIFLEDTGHLMNYEKPKETAEAIRKFVENY